MYKIIGSDQKIYGPVSGAIVKQWQAEGRVHGETLLQAEGSPDWKPLSSYPEFGAPPVVSMPSRPPATTQSFNGMALAGLICGLFSNFCCIGILAGILGIIFSVIALSQLDSHPQYGGRSMALAGLILSIIGLGWHSLFFFGLPPGSWELHRHWRNW